MSALMKIRKVEEKEFPNVGDRIREARMADPRSLVKICEAIGMSPTNWYKIEKGETKVLPLDTLRQIEQALGVDLGVEF